MKAEMDEHGKITISAETPVESFALRQWSSDAVGNSIVKDGRSYVDSSRLVVIAALPK